MRLSSALRLMLFSVLLIQPVLVQAGLLQRWLAVSKPQGQVMRDIAYGSDPLQRLDVYLPAAQPSQATARPVLVMVHGGAWRIGDKANRSVVANKLAHWQQQGWIFISVNYRLLPAASVYQQTEDVAQAVQYIQQHVQQWGGDPKRMVLMGHSAGAHLVALLASQPTWLDTHPQPWQATIALDSAAYDVSQIMSAEHHKLYDPAFGRNPQDWQALSPSAQLKQKIAPFLAVCSTIRPDKPCPQAEQFVILATRLGTDASLLPVALSHGEVNQLLGEQNAYTAAVDDFIRRLGD